MKRLLIIAALFSLMFFASCGKSENTEREKPIDGEETEEVDENEESEVDDAAEPSGNHSNDEVEEESMEDSIRNTNDKDQSTEETKDKEPDAEMIKSGSFNGQADPHTIEIETDEGPVAYQLTIEARDLVVDLEPGDEVTYTYYKDGEMLVIKHIEKVD